MIVEIERPVCIFGIRVPFLWKCYTVNIIGEAPWPTFGAYRLRFRL